MKLFVFMVGNRLCGISHCLAHLRRQVKTKFRLKNISDTALAGLAVDTDHICVIISADICRVNRKIWYVPVIRIFIFSPVHAFGNRILMGTGKCCKYKCSTVWASFVDFHSCTLFVYFTDMRHIGEIKFRIYTLGIHIHAQCNDVYITCTLTVSK